MAFPRNPSDYDEHVENNARFYALGGFWHRRRLPEGGNTKAKNIHTPRTQIEGLGMPHASQMMIVNAVYETDTDTNIRVMLRDATTGGWIPKAKLADPSGFVWWGTGGITSLHWNKSAWGSNEFYPIVRDVSRNIKTGRPQRLRMTLLRAGPNKTMMAWENYSQVVTRDEQVNNYAKVDIGVDIGDIISVSIVPEAGTFRNINIVTEVY